MNKKTIIISICTLLLLAMGVGYYALFMRSTDQKENTVDYNSPTPDQISTGQETKEEFLDRTSGTKEGSTDQAPLANEVSLQISSVSQKDGLLKIRTIIQDTKSGNCSLILSRDGSTSVEQSVETQNMGSYSVCKGFDINTNNLDKGGWKVQIKFTSIDGRKGLVDKQVTIQ